MKEQEKEDWEREIGRRGTEEMINRTQGEEE
jgi:hypothetical protein